MRICLHGEGESSSWAAFGDMTLVLLLAEAVVLVAEEAVAVAVVEDCMLRHGH